MDLKFLEEYYEKVILPLYGDTFAPKNITWKDHAKVGLDSWAHYFDDESGREYVLIYEDFPGSDYMNDELTHSIVLCGSEKSVHISARPEHLVDNVIGYFTLYAENIRYHSSVSK